MIVAMIQGMNMKVIRAMMRWRSGAVVRALDFGPRGPWFDPLPVHISLWP